jgi:uracil phosphoribosyltransferase
LLLCATDEEHEVTTPTDTPYRGCVPSKRVCGVSIVRAGESMEHVLREWVPTAMIGKILIQRDEATAKPFFYFDKVGLPPIRKQAAEGQGRMAGQAAAKRQGTPAGGSA